MDTQRIELRSGWKFHYGDIEEAWYKGYDDSDADKWQEVFVPHDFSVTMPFDIKNSSGTAYLAGGTCWYRVRFNLPEEYRGKTVRICFDGVYKNSMVWCNSYYLGKRPNGYISFSYDITDMVCFGDADNEISVKVSHEDIADSRWFAGSGITRKVYVVVSENVHPTEYGVFFKTEKVSEDGESAIVAVHHAVKNDIKENGEGKEVIIESRLFDEDDNEVLCLKSDAILKSYGKKYKEWMRGTVKNPKLWTAETPYLYRLESRYKLEGSKEKYLVDVTYVGIREVSFDANKGLFVNGRSVKLKGVCVHHDGGCLGAAMQKEVWQRRLSKLKEAGCNAIRCSHNPHMPELYELCDRMGFYMMDEAFDEWENAKNKWSTGHNVYPPKHQGYFEDFHEWHEKDLTAMVKRDRNHPSVIMYSIGNEVDYPNDPYCHPMFDTMTGNNDANKPEAERRFDINKPNMERLSVIAKELVSIVKKADDTRAVTAAAAFPELSSRIGFLDNYDVIGYNYKEHLYAEDHKRFPDRAFLGSENGHEYKHWRAVTDNDYVCGQFLWTGIDYLGEAHGWPVHGSTAGIITTAGLEKPEFLRRKTFWSDEKTICILTRRISDGPENWLPMSNAWDYKKGEEILVKIYATEGYNSKASVFINGDSKGFSQDKDDDNAFIFKVNFEEGTLRAEAEGEKGSVKGQLVTPKVSSAKDVNFDISVWEEDDLLTGESFKEASSKIGYLYQIHVTAKDSDGNILRSAVSGKDFFMDRDMTKADPEKYREPEFMKSFPEVEVEVEGAGELAGIDSGNLADSTSFTEKKRRVWNGETIVFVRRTKTGSVNIKINGQNIKL